MFLKGFTDKVQDVRSSTSGSSDPDFTEYSGEMFNSFTPLDIAAVRELIAKSPNKSCFLDPIPTCRTWLVKEFAVKLAPFIAAVINRSLEVGYFPVSFRAAVITPILKKSTLDPANVSSYRSISNLCYLSKLLERVVKNQLMDHVERNRLLPEHQSAYRACHSTESALLKVTSDALLAAGPRHGHTSWHIRSECDFWLRRSLNLSTARARFESSVRFWYGLAPIFMTRCSRFDTTVRRLNPEG